jgi:PDZ domain-containing protein
MTEQQTEQQPAKDSLGKAMKRSEKVFLGLLIFAVATGLFIRFVPVSFLGVDVVALSPGSAPTTIEKINIEGAQTYAPDGEIKFTTVSIESDSLTIWEWFRAKNDEIRELRDRQDFYGDKTKAETRKINNFMMQQSQDTASLVAANYLGYEIVPEIDGSYVVEIVTDSPADTFLQLGDLIVEVEGIKVTTPKDLGDAIKSKKPGDSVSIGYKRSEGTFQVPSPDQEVITEQVSLTTHPTLDQTGFLGVVIQTPLAADIPFDISIDVGRVGGPSAGLAFALSIVDYLTEGELTGGLSIATTGTIDQYGNVGSVGAYAQKAEAAARSGVDVFLVPPAGYETVERISSGRFEVRCVSTFNDAIFELAAFGGNGIQLAIDQGLPMPERSESVINPDDGYTTCAEVTLENNND